MDKKIFTKKETAQILNVHVNSLTNWDRAGILKPSRLGRRVFYTEDVINKALDQHGK